MNQPTNSRTLSIRRWIAIIVLGLFLAPILGLVTVGVILFAPTHGPESETADAIARITDEEANWSAPSWQQQTSAWLADKDMSVVLMDGDEIVWQSSADPLAAGTLSVRRIDLADNASFILYSPHEGGPPHELHTVLVPIAVLTAVAAAIIAVAWFLRRAIIEPLTATSQAAQALAEGSFAGDIPKSRVREINDLSESFLAMRDSLQTSLTRQDAVEKERRFLISAVAHDLRTPLFALRGSLEGIVQGIADTEAKRDQYLQIALRRADDLEKLISDLFAWTRLDLTGIELNRTSQELDVLLDTVIESMRPQADARQIQLISASEPVTISVDADLLRRAIDNVVNNALAHTPDEGFIEITSKRDGETVLITIRDSGAGILERDLE